MRSTLVRSPRGVSQSTPRRSAAHSDTRAFWPGRSTARGTSTTVVPLGGSRSTPHAGARGSSRTTSQPIGSPSSAACPVVRTFTTRNSVGAVPGLVRVTWSVRVSGNQTIGSGSGAGGTGGTVVVVVGAAVVVVGGGTVVVVGGGTVVVVVGGTVVVGGGAGAGGAVVTGTTVGTVGGGSGAGASGAGSSSGGAACSVSAGTTSSRGGDSSPISERLSATAAAAAAAAVAAVVAGLDRAFDRRLRTTAPAPPVVAAAPPAANAPALVARANRGNSERTSMLFMSTSSASSPRQASQSSRWASVLARSRRLSPSRTYAPNRERCGSQPRRGSAWRGARRDAWRSFSRARYPSADAALPEMPRVAATSRGRRPSTAVCQSTDCHCAGSDS